MKKHRLKSVEIPLNDSYDVIVVGGGPSGCTAAAASAREGAKTLLIEAAGIAGAMALKKTERRPRHKYRYTERQIEKERCISAVIGVS